MPISIRKTYQQEREHAIAAYRRHLRPESLLAGLRRATDRALKAIVRQHPLPGGAALLAVGGYGRGELFPGSDVDILVLLAGPPDSKATHLIEQLVAALWNLGPDLSHSVRTIVDCRYQAAHDITIETSLLETRWLAGSKELLKQLHDAMQTGRDAQRFFLAKRAELVARHAHYQHTPYALEPNCKESPGGLRDLLVPLWVAQAAGLGQTPRDLARAGLLSSSEYRALRRADLAFKRLRIELHLLTGRREDRLLFDLQPRLAERYGFTDTATHRASELLMQRYYWAARVVSELNLILMQLLEEYLFPDVDWSEQAFMPGIEAVSATAPAGLLASKQKALLSKTTNTPSVGNTASSSLVQTGATIAEEPTEALADPSLATQPQSQARQKQAEAAKNQVALADAALPESGFRLRHGRIDILEDNLFEQRPELLLKVFLLLQKTPAARSLSARTLRAIWHARKRVDAAFRRKPENSQTFLQILQEPRLLMQSLQTLTLLNILPNYLPEFRRVTGQMQHDLFHAYTVDQHTLLVIRNLHRFTQAEHAHEYPLASQIMAGLDRPWLLYIAALYHDIAKGRGGDHSELGAIDARKFCEKHGLNTADTELIVFLVREHLSLSHTAQKRDLSDPAIIYEFARRIKTRRRLDALYLLTVADIRGTSSKIWNAWKGKLLETLYTLSLAALDNLAEGASIPDQGATLQRRKQKAAVRIAALGINNTLRDAFWSKLDIAYFLRHSAEEIAWHTGQLHNRVDKPEPAVISRLIGNNDGLQVAVYTPDRSDLFVTICHYFDRHQLGIQEARIHTTLHGWALDSFIVLPLLDKDTLAPRATQIEAELARVLKTGAAPPYYGNTTGRHHRPSPRARAFPIAPTIELQPDEHSQSWRLAISAADRPGLLYQLARTFTQHNINLLMAKIMTLGDRVEDIFIIQGEALAHPQTQLQFERSLLATLQTPT